ncbi:hypothetical protein [Arthrobacter sp. zg-Y750]|uniref:hypothetical protein n=1 Tax=Arthrobacter sp. zg-Y750 TaxID=2894189 RepID=UPI001E3D1404|nr:hypothetical protein [Arthrobacter sp. zg-Y750]MCC9178998.1 hypothetical protein [Arthrobacter sp. zg-Y750]
MTRKAPARKAPFRAIGLAVLTLALGACAGTNGDGGGTATGSSSSSASDASSCSTISPNSPGEENCQAAGIPGSTAANERCSGTPAASPTDGLNEGTFGPYCENAVAISYNAGLIPDDAEGIVTVTETNADTTVELTAQGFSPDMTFTAQLHERTCGADPADAGGLVQNPQDSTGGNGLAVDFTTDSSGNATATGTVPWVLPGSSGGHSLLIFEAGGSENGEAAGCLTLAQ